MFYLFYYLKLHELLSKHENILMILEEVQRFSFFERKAWEIVIFLMTMV